MSKKYAFFHSADLDGHMSGAIAKIAIPEVELVPFDYGESFPWEKIEPQSTIYLMDLSLQPYKDMLLFQEKGHKLIWIDHHLLAITEVDNLGLNAEGLRSIEFAACELAWEYFFPGKEMPPAVELAGAYDSWRWEREGIPEALLFHYGTSGINSNPAIAEGFRNLYKIIFSRNETERVVEAGKKIKDFVDLDLRGTAEAMAFETVLDGVSVIACNRRLTNSRLFESVKKNFPNCKVFLTFGWHKNVWKCSLYSEDTTNCGEIAKKFGGGGHKNAAGFQCKTLPFKLGSEC